MKWYRVIFLFIWMMSIAASSYAGIKKCAKQFSNNAKQHTSVVSKKQLPPLEKGDVQSKDICAASILIYCQQHEETIVRNPLQVIYTTVSSQYFYLHTNKPFLPPRLA